MSDEDSREEEDAGSGWFSQALPLVNNINAAIMNGVAYT